MYNGPPQYEQRAQVSLVLATSLSGFFFELDLSIIDDYIV